MHVIAVLNQKGGAVRRPSPHT